MFHEQRTTVPDSPAQLREEYRSELTATVDDHGLETAVDETGLDRSTLEGVLDGDASDISLEEAAEILALEEGIRDAETVVTMATENLLMGMSTAVMDVDAVESELEIEMDAKEAQQKIERRASMSFEEYVHLQHVIVGNMP
ncbi:DUF5791 family protein [Natronobacterium gregoryi]|uniref:Uncharacterized protein n=2 Tax=Natronobacterium gregoryi TaxID=44930 RepID=L0ADH9_NATGS|nr:DUF5791 family protein [Natronobacterium gregoryi]AFZ71911.1 hypothetical protein Natgr_0664 [Natronobacterium gregoryi SP2]ELY62468.1 hypothetical protein C490_17938 [Natronobacterium gregoryi SP2]PLK20695.1 hypothetical protein CYV19_08035 [Natronobacterium gregoryi SP2]SFJ14169.1 hypothetical protein SAMN05443661_11557 [Natronobacterium gregoryi]